MQIQSKTYLITGAASGLGFAVAQKIISKGGNAILLDINEDKGLEAQQTLGNNSLFIKTNVSYESSVINAIEQTKQKNASIHGVINCAGIGPSERTVGKNGPQSLESFERIININLIGTFNMIRLAVNEMQNNDPDEGGERGIVINTASVAAFDGQIGQAAYSASKGGIVAMTLPLAREFARMGIRVMTIAPGIFETPLLKSMSAEVQESLGKQIPFPSRLGKPEEFAALAIHIIENSMLNGEVIRLDGAIRMTAK